MSKSIISDLSTYSHSPAQSLSNYSAKMWHNSDSTVWTGLRYMKDYDTVEISINKVPIIINEGDTSNQVIVTAYGESQKLDLKENGKLFMENSYRYEMLDTQKGSITDFVNFSQSTDVIKRNKCFDPEGKTKIQGHRWWFLWKTTTNDFYDNISNILANAEAALKRNGEKKIKIVDSLKEFMRKINVNSHYKFPRIAEICQRAINDRHHNEAFDPLAIVFGRSRDFEEIGLIARLLNTCVKRDEKACEISDHIYEHITNYFPMLENFGKVLNSLDQEDEWNEMLRVIGFIFHLLFWDVLPKKQTIITRLLDTFMDSDVDAEARFIWLTNVLMILSGNAPGRWKKIISGIDQYYDNIITDWMPDQYEADQTSTKTVHYEESLSELTIQYRKWARNEKHIHEMIIERIESLRKDHKMSIRCQMMYEKATKVIEKRKAKPRPATASAPKSNLVVEDGGMLVISVKTKAKAKVHVPIPASIPVAQPKAFSYASAVTGAKATTSDSGTMTETPKKSYIPSSIQNKQRFVFKSV
jgi:hypothetical protein